MKETDINIGKILINNKGVRNINLFKYLIFDN